MDKKHRKLLTTLRNHKLPMSELTASTGLPEADIQKYIEEFRKIGTTVDITQARDGTDMLYHVNVLPDRDNVFYISGSDGRSNIRFASSSDWHFGSKFFLPKTWHECMKRAEDSGINKVYVAGDLMDGDHVYSGQIENLSEVGIEDQTDVVAEALIRHPNLEFWGIAGNHDYSFTKQNGAKPLAILEAKVDNFKNLGDLQADVIYKGIRIRLLHGASGRTYAISYPSQTYLRDYFKGLERRELPEVPHIILLGHYHTLYSGKDHGIHVLQSGSFQDGKNEYCVRRGLTGPNGLFLVELDTRGREIEHFKATYVQPDMKEKGKEFAKTTRSYR
jgi:predicted phosphodiesterase